MKNRKKQLPDTLVCEICGDKMKRFSHVYDNNQYGKNYYKCDTCGHKICLIR